MLGKPDAVDATLKRCAKKWPNNSPKVNSTSTLEAPKLPKKRVGNWDICRNVNSRHVLLRLPLVSL